jgi:outer membrane receptor protein involved in Fe transport
MLKSMTLRSTLLAFACSISITAYAMADTPKAVNVLPGKLTDALETLARQCGVDVIYASAQLKGLETQGVSGTLEPIEAFRRLLEGTPLVLKQQGTAVLITLPASTPRTNTTPAASSEREGADAKADPKPSFWQRFQLARADDEANAEDASSRGERVDPGEVIVGVPEVLVRGSKSLNMDIRRTRDDTQPYVVLDRATIEKSGASNIEELLRRRLTMSASSRSASTVPTENGNISQIDLRGLGAGQTLILIDGHRTASYGFGGIPQQPDLNGIPLSAVERIEVLPTTASGIYGGSATGGVINIILRRDYSGIDSSLTYGDTFSGGGAERRVDFSGGFNFEGGKTNLLLSGSYADSSALLAGDRDLVQRGRARIFANIPAAFINASSPTLGATTNICSGSALSCNNTPLSLKAAYGGAVLSSSRTFVPYGYAGAASDNGAALVANAGHYNLDLASTAQSNGGAGQSLRNAPTVESLAATLRRKFTGRLEAFLEASAANNTGEFVSNGASRTFVIPSTAAVNPFNQQIRVTAPIVGGDSTLVSTMYDRRAIGGVIVELPKNWHAEADYTWSRTRFYSSSPGSLATSLATSAVTSGTVNLLRDINAYPVDFTPYILPPAVISPAHTTLRDATLRTSGPLWMLPAGPVTLSGLVEHRKEVFGDFIQTVPATPTLVLQSLFPSRNQSTDSVYLEASVPVFSATHALPGVQLLDLQLAVRHDEYKTVGADLISITNGVPNGPVRNATNRFNSTDPTLGLRYKPIADVMLRASYGTGFLPPGVNQLVPGAEQTVTPSTLLDPRRNNQPVGQVTLTSGGNPNLLPEESRSWSAGMVFTPRFAPNLRLSVDWTRIDKTGNITSLGLTQVAIDNELFVPGLVTRAAPQDDGFPIGPITGISSALFNAASQHVEAYDLAFDYRIDTAGSGEFSIASTATRQLHNKTQSSVTAPVVENVAFVDGLKWKGNVTLNWDWRQWTLGWTTTYFDSYRLGDAASTNPPIASQGSATIPSQIYHDVFASYRFAGSGRFASLFSGTRIDAGVRNIFNKEPPVDVFNTLYYYSRWGDPRLSSYYVTLRKSFE